MTHYDLPVNIHRSWSENWLYIKRKEIRVVYDMPTSHPALPHVREGSCPQNDYLAF